MIYSTAILLIMIAIPPIFLRRVKMSEKGAKIMLCANVLVFCVGVILAAAMMFSSTAIAADVEGIDGADSAVVAVKETTNTGTANSVASWAFIAAAMATGLACIGAGIAVAAASSSALGAISDQPGIMGKALIFVALAEGIALYGLLISFSILGRV